MGDPMFKSIPSSPSQRGGEGIFFGLVSVPHQQLLRTIARGLYCHPAPGLLTYSTMHSEPFSRRRVSHEKAVTDTSCHDLNEHIPFICGHVHGIGGMGPSGRRRLHGESRQSELFQSQHAVAPFTLYDSRRVRIGLQHLASRRLFQPLQPTFGRLHTQPFLSGFGRRAGGRPARQHAFWKPR
jgi:hypothetical protein